jgi:hypothetical protein
VKSALEAKYLVIRFLGKFSGLVLQRIADFKALNKDRSYFGRLGLLIAI